jgi:NTE family protein
MTKKINVGLQGGGSHGAFAWGVLDRLLADERVEIVAATGASAGAMNAVLLAHGLANGSREEARQVLRDFWQAVVRAALNSPLQRSPWQKAVGDWSLEGSPGFVWFDLLSRLASPKDVNPFNINPLRDLLAGIVDFDRARSPRAPRVFITATNVETGRAVVFDQTKLDVDRVMASACLPHMFHPVIIDGVPYWDGGYTGNPPLWPLFEHSPSDDVVIIQINPFRRLGPPMRAREIMDRVTEITFNASLLRELRTIDFVTRLMDDGRLDGTGYRRVLVHMIGDEETLRPLGASSKLNAEEAFVDMLFETGVAAADRWLAANFDAIGERSTINLRALFQGEDDALDGERISRPAAAQTARSRGAGGE